MRRKLQREQPITAVEFGSPANYGIERFMNHVEFLKEAGVDAVTIADCPTARTYVNSSLIACKLHWELGLDVIPHMTCHDRNTNATKALLSGLQIEGIRNVLVVTGDPTPSEDRQEVKGVFNFNSQISAGYIRDLNATMFASPFMVFGALNLNAVNFEAESAKVKRKVTQGMEGFLTQPVYSRQAPSNLKRARKELQAYILGDVLPIVSHRNVVYMNNKISRIEADKEIVATYEGTTRKEAQKLAVDTSCKTMNEMRSCTDGYYLITLFNRAEVIADMITYTHKQWPFCMEAGKGIQISEIMVYTKKKQEVTMKQKTFLTLKPDVLAGGYVQEVLRELRSHGLVTEKSCILTVTMGVMKTLINYYAGVIDSMSKGSNFPGKLFNSLYYDGPHTITSMEVNYKGSDDIIMLAWTLAGKTNPQDAGAGTIREKHGDDSYEKASIAVYLVNDVIHASDSHESVQRELNIWKSYLKQTDGL